MVPRRLLTCDEPVTGTVVNLRPPSRRRRKELSTCDGGVRISATIVELVAFSRVNLGVHWLSDVVGAVASLAGGWTPASACRRGDAPPPPLVRRG